MKFGGAEYQENNALLLEEKNRELFTSICVRENCEPQFIGQITGDGRVVLHDSTSDRIYFDLSLAKVLGDMPQKSFIMHRRPLELQPLRFPHALSIRDALERVLCLLSVGSKRFLTTKVDRSVTGLIAQQQCVGPLHIPLADVAVVAQSLLSGGVVAAGQHRVTGIATAIGEQPIKGLICTKSMARMSVGEALTNLVWAKVSSLFDVKASANWMYVSFISYLKTF